jgi:hypothetical protein
MVGTRGKTMGKLAAGVRVIRSDGGPVGGLRALWRELLKSALLVGCTALFLLAPPFGMMVGSGLLLLQGLLPLFDPEARTLHDHFAGTRVVHARGPGPSPGVRQAILVTLCMYGGLALYELLPRWEVPAVRLSTRTAWDDLFPFRPAWLGVYLTPFLAVPVLAALLRPGTFAWFLRRGLAVAVLTVAAFALVPTQVERPGEAEAAGGGLTAELYRRMVALDKHPGNAAPSLHVSLTCLLALALSRDGRRRGAAAFAWTGLVWLSTLFTRQHYLIDVASGVLLAGLVGLPWPGVRRAVSPDYPLALRGAPEHGGA